MNLLIPILKCLHYYFLSNSCSSFITFRQYAFEKLGKVVYFFETVIQGHGRQSDDIWISPVTYDTVLVKLIEYFSPSVLKSKRKLAASRSKIGWSDYFYGLIFHQTTD